ncbi:DUF4424 family protein [Aureimonas sp. AU22]|uniref:DUF4424 family protein n=1 Tax=Aureimonas sp. AU22 TaxID=1638162 RepID=UPI00351C0D16
MVFDGGFALRSRPTNLVSFCAAGVRKTSPTTFEVRHEAFVPKQNLAVRFFVRGSFTNPVVGLGSGYARPAPSDPSTNAGYAAASDAPCGAIQIRLAAWLARSGRSRAKRMDSRGKRRSGCLDESAANPPPPMRAAPAPPRNPSPSQ